MRLAALLILLCCAAARPQELVEVVPPEQRTTTRVILVVDVSGSMKQGGKLERAVAAALDLARQGGDQLELACYAFAAGDARWPAPEQEDGKAPAGWCELPDETVLKHLNGWLCTPPITDGGTMLAGALERALAEPRDKLTVIVISDGDLHDADRAAEVLRAGQAKRQEAGLGAAVVACWTIGGVSASLNQLAKAGGGGCWRESAAPPPPQIGPFRPQETPPPPQGSLR